MKKLTRKFGVLYTDGGQRTDSIATGGGCGIHGYIFDELESVRFAKAPELITPSGYEKKPTGAQLKDKSYNPSWEEWGYKKALQDDGVCKDGSESLVMIDGVIPAGTNTAQWAELTAFIKLIENDDFECEKYIVYSDSAYLVDGWHRDLPNWKARNWKLSSGQPVKNLDLWLVIDMIKEGMGDRISLRKIDAHNGHYGNEAADQLATGSVAAAMNKVVDATWKYTPIKDSSYWQVERPIPPIMRTKWIYSLTEVEVEEVTFNDETYYVYLTGDHNKDADDMELLGKNLSDAGFALIFHKEKVEVVEKLKQFHEDNMWDHDCEMYKSQFMHMVAASTVNTEAVAWKLENIPIECNFVKNDRNDVMDVKKNLLSKVIRPPKLSLRILDEQWEIMQVMVSALWKLGHKVESDSDITEWKDIVVKDVTELFYETPEGKNGKPGAAKMTSFYDQVAKSVTIDYENPCGKPAPVILTRGTELPTRNLMSGITPDNPKVYTVAWPFSKRAFKYGLLIITDTSAGFWFGPYTNKRFLREEDI